MSESNADARTIWSWCFYDWANSAFTTLVVTFIYSTYFTRAIAATPEVGTAQWSRAVAASALLIAFLSPILGAAADRGRSRRKFLFVTTYVSIVATTALAFVTPDSPNAVLWALTLFVVANVAFELAMVFYNAFLPDIAAPEKIGRISGYGWGLGYVGGLLCMIIALTVFVRDVPLFGIPTDEGFNVRATNLLVAGWVFVFSVPVFLFVKDKGKARGGFDVAATFRELGETFRQIRKYREVVKFLIARLVYNDGLVTVFAFGGIYAAGTFGMELSEVIMFGIVLNVAAGLGAASFGFIDDLLGGKKTVMVSVVALALSTLIAVLAPTKLWLWVGGIGIGIFAGPNQSASRSLMGRFVPDRHTTEFFGFFAFSGKVTSFLGPILLGAATVWFDNQRAGVATVLLFFIFGGLLLHWVNEAKGVAESKQPLEVPRT